MVITHRDCPGCRELKRRLPNLKYVDVTERIDIAKLADALKVKAVPQIVQVDRKAGKICLLNDDLKTVKCIINKKFMKIL